MASAKFPLDDERVRGLEAALQQALSAVKTAPPLLQAARYVMGWEDERGNSSTARGKRARPALCIVVCEALGGTFQQALPGAVAVELVHNFSLVHDEVQDNDIERHGRPTIWTRIGSAQAINVGNVLYTAAISVLIHADAADGTKIRALQSLANAVSGMVGGQWDDLSFEGRADVALDEYLRMIGGKTGALMAAPVELGAILAGAPPQTVTILGEWGRNAGLAFQVQDDYLGIWGNPDATGKSNTNDIARRKTSYPIIVGLSDPDARAVIAEEYGAGRPEGPNVPRVMAALERCGARERTRSAASALAGQARAVLESSGLSEGSLEALLGVEAALVDRQG